MGDKKALMLIFKKRDGIFYLNNIEDFGEDLEMASGEYRNGILTMITKVSRFDLTPGLDSYINPTVIFTSRDFSTTIWAQVLPFTIPSNDFVMADLTVLNPEHLIVSFPHQSSYMKYCGSEIFMRGNADLVVALLNSTTGECSAVTTIGKSGEGFYLGNVIVIREGKKILVNGYREIEEGLSISQLTVNGTVYICEHGRNYKGKCICEAGYFGDNCSNKCSPDYCNGHGKCYVENNQAKCMCDYGYQGDDCQTERMKDCGAHGKWYIKENDELGCACNDSYSGEDCAIPPPSCPTSDSGSDSPQPPPQPTPGQESGSGSGSGSPQPTPKPTPEPTPELSSSSAYCSECAKHCKMDVAPALNPFTLFFH